VEPPKAISTRVTFSYEITDFDLVPDKYKKVVIDDDKLGTEVKKQQVTAVPGVKIIRTETPIFR
jgi:flagellar basal body P-ring protein FlgI